MDEYDQKLMQQAEQLLVFLLQIKGEDADRAQQAARFLADNLERVKEAMDRAQKIPSRADREKADLDIELGMAGLEGSLGPKGIHETMWTPENRKKIEEITYDR